MANFNKSTTEEVVKLSMSLIDKQLFWIANMELNKKNGLKFVTKQKVESSIQTDDLIINFIKGRRAIEVNIQGLNFKCYFEDQLCNIVLIETKLKEKTKPFRDYFDKFYTSDPSENDCWLIEESDIFISINYDNVIEHFVIAFMKVDYKYIMNQAIMRTASMNLNPNNNVSN